MISTKNTTWAARVAALGLSAAIAGGAVLVAAAPAQAAPTSTVVHQQDIRANEDTYPGWHQGYANAADRALVSDGTLELTKQSQVLYGYTADEYVSGESLASVVTSGSWTTSWGVAYFQLPFLYNGGKAGGAQSFTTLRPASPVTGTNHISLDDPWTTSSALTDAEGAPLYEKDATASLGEFLAALDTPQLIGFGVLTDGEFVSSQPDTAAYVDSVAFNGTTYTFAPTGAATVSGDAVVGSTLTAAASGFPEGSQLSYQWFASGGQFGGPIDGATSATYTVTDAEVGLNIGVTVHATLDGYTKASVFSANVTDAVTAPKKPAAPAPVADSSGLSAFLAAHGVTPGTPQSAGLPATLDPSKPYTASVEWTAPDSFVDVYLYSSPILLGTFPVVDGKVQVTLSADVLAKLAAGTHTLVLTGQSSGAVQAVTLSLAAVTTTAALADTGSNAAVPATIAGLLVLLGAAGVLVTRRRRAAQG